MDNRVISSQEQLIDLMFWKNAFLLNTTMPAIVDAFDASSQRVSAIPAIQAKIVTPEGEVQYINYPKITNIPLAIIKSPGLKLTYPVKKGQNCTLIFSQRSIDNFLLDGTQPLPPTEGQVPNQTTIRCMDLTDALCFPGVICNNETISNYNNNAIEIRNADGTTKVSVSENDLNLIQGGATLQMTGGNITISASSITITGATTINGKDFDTHKHSGVTTGGGTTGGVV